MPQTPLKKIKPTMEYSTTLILYWICFLLSSSYCMLALLSTKKKKKKHHPPLPPGPTPLPLVGNLNLLRGRDDPHRCLAELAASYGPLMTLRFGRVTTIVVSSPELAREALHKNDGGLSGRFVFDVLRAAGHHTASVVWRPPDPKWHRLRALYNKHLFSSRSLEASQGVRRKKMEELRAALDDAGRARRAVGVRRLAQGTLNNVISNLEFSVDMVRLGSETVPEFQALCRELNVEAAKPNAADFFPALRLVDLQGRRRRSAELLRKVHAIFDVMIEERRRGREKKKDLLEVLLEQEKEEGEEEGGDYNLQMNSLFVVSDMFLPILIN